MSSCILFSVFLLFRNYSFPTDLHNVVVVGAAHVVEHRVELIIPTEPGVVAA